MLAACSGAESNGVVTFTDDERLSKFEIPKSWHVYELPELSELEDMPFDEQVQGFSFPAISSVGFDGGPVRDVSNLAAALPEADYPIGSMSEGRSEEIRNGHGWQRRLLPKRRLRPARFEPHQVRLIDQNL